MALLFCCQSTLSQTHVLRTSLEKDIDEVIISSHILKNIDGKHLGQKYIYITENDSYITFAPNFRNSDLRYELPNFPTFTYLKNFDFFVVQKLDKKEILSHDEFSKLFSYKPTNEFKNYFGIEVEKYTTKNNFYECSFLVAEGESNIDSHPYLKILKDLKLLNLQPNQKVIAMNYLGIEFDISYVALKRESGKNINEEIYREDNIDEDVDEEDFTEIYNLEKIKHLLNKDYEFDTKKSIVYSDLDRYKSTDTLNILLDSKSDITISFYKEFFTLNLNTHFIRGKLNEDGSLQPENYYALKDTTKINSLDFSKYKVISNTSSKDNIELILQSDKGFWSFYKYTINIKPKDDKNVSIIKLPNNLTIEGHLENFQTFTASYRDFEYERSTKRGEEKPLEQTKTFYLHE